MEPAHALVTGASAGIGAAFARELAARGHALILTARRSERLEALAAELRAGHGVDVQCIACDLADPAAPQFLCEEAARRGLVVDTLVNNAGYGVTGTFLSRPWATHADFVQVMMTAPTELCHRLLPGMRARGDGRIVNVASLAGLLPAPAGHTLYAASKAYLIKFSQALALENRPHGIRVCALCPGFTYSEFHDVNGARELVQDMPRWLWMDAAPVVREAFAALERGDVVRVSGRVNRAIKGFFKLLPDRLALRLIDKRGKDFRVADDSPAPPR
ncbi:SDR family NAD(P)-dependent oxidoreductase [Dokdonella ginsengisoli]|uniref:SDR family NAD(P)-dependent oxidoreductase n=1 Tax=Dokdonella ginsengisoli TaxID=363846 RepID=A0ABV9QUQ2_9GAMM